MNTHGSTFHPLGRHTLAAIPTDSGSVFGPYGADQLPDIVSGSGRGLAGALGVETKRMNSEVWG
jgi:hypothetical protein